MAAEARDYEDVLREAQARGYAEADPSSDVEGLDAAYKLTLLARLAFDGWLDVAACAAASPSFGAASHRPASPASARPTSARRPGWAWPSSSSLGPSAAPSGGVRAGVTPMAVSGRLAAGRHARRHQRRRTSTPTRSGA